MKSPALTGRSILVVEDEVVIAYDLKMALQNAGATVLLTDTPRDADILIESTKIDGAILDHGLNNGQSRQLYASLKRRNVPFVIHTGMTELIGDLKGAAHIVKPANPGVVVIVLAGLIRAKEAASSHQNNFSR
jgi:DNA-binding response OmpR family regulator